MRILVTGANGFVGSHLAESLIEQGHTVVSLVRSTSNCTWLAGLPTEHCIGDLSREDTLKDAVTGVDAVVHSAGILRALKTETYYQVNQQGTRALAQAVLRYNPGLRKFVYISSQAAMGPSLTLSPKSLQEPENPVSDYGRSKLAGEAEVKNLFTGKLPFTILRPASVYGPRDRDIFIFFRLVKWGLRPRTTTKRYLQLLFVKDLAHAVLNALARPQSDNKTYFLAEESVYTWEEVAKTIAGTMVRRTLPLPLPDAAFYGTSFIAEKVASLWGKPAVLNRQKITEMTQSYWLGDAGPARKDLSLDFTKLEFGAKITYSWYSAHKWL